MFHYHELIHCAPDCSEMLFTGVHAHSVLSPLPYLIQDNQDNVVSVPTIACKMEMVPATSVGIRMEVVSADQNSLNQFGLKKKIKTVLINLDKDKIRRLGRFSNIFLFLSFCKTGRL